MKVLSESELQKFKSAILADYGVELSEEELYIAAFNLLQFFEALIEFDKGSKAVLNNPLITATTEVKIE